MSETLAAAAKDDPLWTPQMVIALTGMVIVAGTIAAGIVYGSPETRSQIVGNVVPFASAILGFYFGSSAGSQKKDAVAAQQAAAQPQGASTNA